MLCLTDISGQGSMFGLDTGNPAADFEAEMWIAALIGEWF